MVFNILLVMRLLVDKTMLWRWMFGAKDIKTMLSDIECNLLCVYKSTENCWLTQIYKKTSPHFLKRCQQNCGIDKCCGYVLWWEITAAWPVFCFSIAQENNPLLQWKSLWNDLKIKTLRPQKSPESFVLVAVSSIV